MAAINNRLFQYKKVKIYTHARNETNIYRDYVYVVCVPTYLHVK